MRPGKIEVDFASGLLRYDDAIERRYVPNYAIDARAYAKGNGTDDDTAAIQAAVGVLRARGGGRLVFPRGRYHLDGAVTIDADNIEIVLSAGAYVEKDPATTAIEPFVFQGTAPAAFDNLTADPVAGDVDIIVTTPANFTAGDWVMVKDDQPRFNSPSTKDHWEINRVRSKSGNVLTLEYPLADDYVTISSVAPSVSRFTPVLRSGVVGPGKITNGTPSNSAIGNAGVRFSYAVGGYVRGVEFEYCQQDAVRYFDSFLGEITENDIHDASNFDGSGRGITIARSTHTIASDNRLVRLRHGVDLSNFCRFVLVEGNVLRGCGESGYKTHPDVKWAQFKGNTVDGGYGSASGGGADWVTTIPAPGFNIDRANRFILVEGNIIANTRSSGLTISTEETEYVTVRGNKFRKCNLTGGTQTGGGIAAVQFADNVSVDWAGYVFEQNEFHDMNGRGITCGISNAIIRGNKFYGGTASGSINAAIFVRNFVSGTPSVVNDVVGTLVEDNYVEGGAGYGIYIGSSDADVIECTVRHNRVKDTVNSGIYGVPAQLVDPRIYGNEVSNCNTGDSSSHGGIVVGVQGASIVACDNLLIEGNKVYACYQRGIMTVVNQAVVRKNEVYESVGASAIGIYVPSGASGQVADDIVIEENLVVGCAGSGIFVADSASLGTVTDPVIARNVTLRNGIGIRVRQLSTSPFLIDNISIGDTTPFQDDGATTPRFISHITPLVPGGGFGRKRRKAADQTKTSDTTLADDTELLFAVVANARYEFRFHVFFDTVAAADFKCDVNGPASPTLVRMRRQGLRPGETAYAGIGVWTAFAQLLTLAGAGTTGGHVIVEGLLHNGANAGNVSFRWAQDTSDAGATIVRAGSYIEWTRL